MAENIPNGAEQATYILSMAQKVSDETIANAKIESEKILQDAQFKAESIISEATNKSNEMYNDAHRKVDETLQNLKDDERKLVEKITSLQAFEAEYKKSLKEGLDIAYRGLFDFDPPTN